MPYLSKTSKPTRSILVRRPHLVQGVLAVAVELVPAGQDDRVGDVGSGLAHDRGQAGLHPGPGPDVAVALGLVVERQPHGAVEPRHARGEVTGPVVAAPGTHLLPRVGELEADPGHPVVAQVLARSSDRVVHTVAVVVGAVHPEGPPHRLLPATRTAVRAVRRTEEGATAGNAAGVVVAAVAEDPLLPPLVRRPRHLGRLRRHPGRRPSRPSRPSGRRPRTGTIQQSRQRERGTPPRRPAPQT